MLIDLVGPDIEGDQHIFIFLLAAGGGGHGVPLLPPLRAQGPGCKEHPGTTRSSCSILFFYNNKLLELDDLYEKNKKGRRAQIERMQMFAKRSID